MKIAPIVLAAAGLTGLWAGPTLAAGAGSCFRISEMQGHTVADAHTLYVGDSRHEVYRLTMSGACLAAKTSSDPLITVDHGAGDLVCKPIDIDLSIGGPGGRSHCIVADIHKLSPAEAAALPKKLRP